MPKSRPVKCLGTICDLECALPGNVSDKDPPRKRKKRRRWNFFMKRGNDVKWRPGIPGQPELVLDSGPVSTDSPPESGNESDRRRRHLAQKFARNFSSPGPGNRCQARKAAPRSPAILETRDRQIWRFETTARTEPWQITCVRKKCQSKKKIMLLVSKECQSTSIDNRVRMVISVLEGIVAEVAAVAAMPR